MANNLPVQLTSFVGRSAELATVGALVSAHRLVTLTGPGGCGKTRLALEAAARAADDVCWVDLAPLADASLVPAAVAAALGMPEPPEPLVEALVRRLAARPALVVLDNCEHLVDACAVLATRLLQECPTATVLATSRELLGVPGEVRVPVPPLSLPEDDAIAASESVRLFVDRARASWPGFGLDDHNAPVVAQICRRLDGLPLAIELAAARTRLLSVQQIADGLADRFRLLTGGARAALPRQRTLEGSVDWSHHLLGDLERIVFRRLAVFAGSFTLEAAEAVCADDSVAAADVLDLLGALVDRSLVQPVAGRYRMLETVADYARHRLADAGEVEAVRDRHVAWCVSFCQRASAGLEGGEQAEWPARIDAELDNVRVALDWGDSPSGTRMVAALLWYWFARSEVAVGRARLEAVVAGEEDGVDRGAALTALCVVAYRAGDMAAAARYGDEAVTAGRCFGDTRVLGRALHFRAWVRYWGEGDRRGAWADFEEAECLLREGDDALVRGLNLSLFGWSCIDTSRAPEARALLEEGLRLLPRRGAPRGYALFALGWLDNLEGRVEDARARFDEALGVAEATGDRYVEILARSLLAILCVDAGSHEEARAHCDRGLALALEQRMPTGEASMRFALAVTALAEGSPEAAAAEFDAAYASTPMPWFAVVLRAFQAQVALARGRLDEARSCAGDALRGGAEHDSVAATALALVVLSELARRDGDLRRAEQQLHDALDCADGAGFRPIVSAVLEGLAAVAADAGRGEEAARLHGAAAAWRDASSRRFGPVPPADSSGLREELGSEAFDAAWAEGAAMSSADVVAYVRRGRGRRTRPAHGWDSLTPTERRVVDLVAEGLTNPQIGRRLLISPRTVQAHLVHVFAKLHVSSRAELASAATARAFDPTT